MASRASVRSGGRRGEGSGWIADLVPLAAASGPDVMFSSTQRVSANARRTVLALTGVWSECATRDDSGHRRLRASAIGSRDGWSPGGEPGEQERHQPCDGHRSVEKFAYHDAALEGQVAYPRKRQFITRIDGKSGRTSL